jgi:hypothetical protein
MDIIGGILGIFGALLPNQEADAAKKVSGDNVLISQNQLKIARYQAVSKQQSSQMFVAGIGVLIVGAMGVAMIVKGE